MSYTKKIFNKDIIDLTISDLQAFFDSEQEESSIMEFKEGKVEINDVFKEVAAFLNTEGGILIIGAPREKKETIGKHTRSFCKGNLTYSKFRNADWLSQKISSNIVPTPSNIKIFEHIDDKGAVFLLEIPQSENPPHQSASEGRYYIRLEKEAKPAPHGIIQALFQKRRMPRLDASIEVQPLNNQELNIKLSVSNRNIIPADKFSFIIELYNIDHVSEGLDFERIDDKFGIKYSHQQNTDQVLVRIISIPIEFTVGHRSSEIIIFIGYWCKDLDFDFKFWTYDPIAKEITCEDRMHHEKTSFTSEIQRVLGIDKD